MDEVLLDRWLGGQWSRCPKNWQILDAAHTAGQRRGAPNKPDGRGANGKSTFLEILSAAFGDYAIRAGARLLYDVDRRGAPPDHQIAELLGRRFVVANETLEGGKLNEGTIKDITGGDTLRGERKYEAGFYFRPTANSGWLAIISQRSAGPTTESGDAFELSLLIGSSGLRNATRTYIQSCWPNYRESKTG